MVCVETVDVTVLVAGGAGTVARLVIVSVMTVSTVVVETVSVEVTVTGAAV